MTVSFVCMKSIKHSVNINLIRVVAGNQAGRNAEMQRCWLRDGEGGGRSPRHLDKESVQVRDVSGSSLTEDPVYTLQSLASEVESEEVTED